MTFAKPSLLAWATMALLSNAVAQTQVCQVSSVPPQLTGWSETVDVELFDPDLGMLTAVDLQLTATIAGSAAYESTNDNATTITTTFAASCSVFESPTGPLLLSVNLSEDFVQLAAPFDGVIDFGGSSGNTFSNLSVTENTNTSLSSSLFPMFIGTSGSGSPGSRELPVVANGVSTGSGSNLILQFVQDAEASVEVCYTYMPDCNQNGIDDEQDIALGTSEDCNANLIPDECLFVEPQGDANQDGVLDDCGEGNDLCSGDGGDGLGCTDCPCQNEAPQGSIGGCLNSVWTSARLHATGSRSVSLPSGAANDLRFTLSNAPPTTFCILISGDSVSPTMAANPCFGLDSGVQSIEFDGLRCAAVMTRRHGGRAANGAGIVGFSTNPWGGEGPPAAGIAGAFGGFSAGQKRFFQATYRDDPRVICERGLNTTQAIEIDFLP